MIRRWAWARILLLATGILLVALAGCAQAGFDAHLQRLVGPYRFRLLQWEIVHFPQALQVPHVPDLAEGATVVRTYFTLAQAAYEHEQMIAAQRGPERTTCPHCEEYELEALRKRLEALRPQVRGVLTGQVEETLRAEGLADPWGLWPWRKILFPPVRFILTEAPHTLIISPRDRIESVRQALLVSNLSLDHIETLERAVERLEAPWAPKGVSALVEEIGGFGGTFPTLVVESSSLRGTIETICEEWAHQYFAFTPLGFRYVLHLLGIRRDYEVARLNETAAGIVAKELRDQVLLQYYPDLAPKPQEKTAPLPAPSEKAFDFNRFMRETRLEVDRLLAAGEIEAAEAYMEARRQELLREGYIIRRLNQAYFAFHGTYADAPTSVDPIGEEMRALRTQSTTLAEFIRKASRLTSRADLQRMIAGH